MTLLQEQKQKHYLNQGSGSFTLRGLESKPGSEGMMVNLESAPDTHVKRPSSKAIRTWSVDVLICILSAWNDISAEPHWYICRYRVRTPRCETLLSARIPPYHRTSRSNLVFSVQLSAGTMLSRKMVCFGVTLPSLPPFLFGILSCLPFVSLSFYL